jgi:hypothetical protein
MGQRFGGTYTATIDLTNAGSQNPATITATGVVTVATGDGIDGAGGFAWTITNLGMVKSTSDVGIMLLDGGQVTNGSSASKSGLVAGSGFGIAIAGQSGTVTNFGAIAATRTSASAPGVGIDLAAGGSVTNGGGADRKAVISAIYNSAIAISGGAGTVGNFGILKNTGPHPGSHAVVYLGAGGSVTNGSGGAPAALIEGVYVGIAIAGDAGTVTNFGKIDGGSTDGVSLSAGGTVTNHGLITATELGVKSTVDAATVTNFGTILSGEGDGTLLVAGGFVTNEKGGLIESYNIGVSAFGAATVVNSGTIKAVDNLYGVYFYAGGSLTNTRGGLIAAVYDVGVSFHNIAGKIVNLGTIEALHLHTGIFLAAGGAVTNGAKAALIEGTTNGVYLGNTATAGHIVNFGTIEGLSGFGFGVAAGNTANNSLTNAGEIVGSDGTAVGFGGGNDVLTVDPGAVFVGAVLGGGGSNEVIEGAAGTLDLNGFSGFETIVMADGGTDKLTLTAANFTGGTLNTITVIDGNDGNDIIGKGLAASDTLVVHAGGRADFLYGGAEKDVFFADGSTTMTGGSGANEFTFTTPGHNIIEDFAASQTNELVFSDAHFHLDLSGGTRMPQQLTAAEAAKLFVADSTGSSPTEASASPTTPKPASCSTTRSATARGSHRSSSSRSTATRRWAPLSFSSSREVQPTQLSVVAPIGT